MTGLFDESGDGPTPLNEEEQGGLIPSYITLRSELNDAEQANILEAEFWAFSRKRDVLDARFLNRLHKRMFGNVWRWAGQYRRSGKNVGVDAYRIPGELKPTITTSNPCLDLFAHSLTERRHWMNAYPGFPGIVVVIPDLQEDVAQSMCSAASLIIPKPPITDDPFTLLLIAQKKTPQMRGFFFDLTAPGNRPR